MFHLWSKSCFTSMPWRVNPHDFCCSWVVAQPTRHAIHCCWLSVTFYDHVLRDVRQKSTIVVIVFSPRNASDLSVCWNMLKPRSDGPSAWHFRRWNLSHRGTPSDQSILDGDFPLQTIHLGVPTCSEIPIWNALLVISQIPSCFMVASAFTSIDAPWNMTLNCFNQSLWPFIFARKNVEGNFEKGSFPRLLLCTE